MIRKYVLEDAHTRCYFSKINFDGGTHAVWLAVKGKKVLAWWASFWLVCRFTQSLITGTRRLPDSLNLTIIRFAHHDSSFTARSTLQLDLMNDCKYYGYRFLTLVKHEETTNHRLCEWWLDAGGVVLVRGVSSVHGGTRGTCRQWSD